MAVADVMWHNSTGRLWSQAGLGELVAVTKPGPKKALESRGQVGYYLYSQSWTNRVSFVSVSYTHLRAHETRRHL
eukprot:2610766-Prorocentrum_lima.AAC.1